MKEDFLSEVQIRPMHINDLDAIVEIENKILGKARRDYWKKKMKDTYTQHPLSSLVAEYEGKVIGFIVGEISGWEFGVPDTVAWISTIGVDPKYQHKGVGKKLSQGFIKKLKDFGVSIVYTLVNWNDWDLLKFFREMGFTRGGEMINLELKLD